MKVSKQKKTRFVMFSLLVVFSALIIGASQSSIYSSISKNLTLLGQIFKEVAINYVDKVDTEEFLKAGVNGMLSTLDPYTTYIEPQDRTQIDMITHGKYGGVGVTLTNRNNQTTVEEPPFLGTPAARAGIREGDIIIKVDDTFTGDLGFDETARKIRGPSGTEVTLTIQREGEEKHLIFKLIREVIKIEDVRYADLIGNQIGYILLSAFSDKAYSELSKALLDMQARGAKGVILDLRSNPGGLLEAAVQVSDLFLPKNSVVVSTKGRASGSDRIFKATQDPIIDLPLAVLVNRISASASEIVAGAIQDNDIGIVLGDTTFGKGLVQTVIPLSSSLLKLTTAKYYTPSGRSIQRSQYSIWQDTTEKTDSVFHTLNGRTVTGGGGIVPDIAIEQPRVNGLVVDLRRKSMFFNFSVHYTANHARPEKPEFEISQSILEEFRKYLNDKKYEYHHPFERDLDGMMNEAGIHGYGEAILQDIDRLRRSFSQIKEKMFADQGSQIKQLLRRELATKYFSVKEGIELDLQDDPVVQKALDILRDPQAYHALLKQ
jgi:carboxyl-terminal processing protease